MKKIKLLLVCLGLGVFISSNAFAMQSKTEINYELEDFEHKGNLPRRNKYSVNHKIKLNKCAEIYRKISKILDKVYENEKAIEHVVVPTFKDENPRAPLAPYAVPIVIENLEILRDEKIKIQKDLEKLWGFLQYATKELPPIDWKWGFGILTDGNNQDIENHFTKIFKYSTDCLEILKNNNQKILECMQKTIEKMKSEEITKTPIKSVLSRLMYYLTASDESYTKNLLSEGMNFCCKWFKLLCEDFDKNLGEAESFKNEAKEVLKDMQATKNKESQNTNSPTQDEIESRKEILRQKRIAISEEIENKCKQIKEEEEKLLQIIAACEEHYKNLRRRENLQLNLATRELENLEMEKPTAYEICKGFIDNFKEFFIYMEKFGYIVILNIFWDFDIAYDKLK